MSACWACSIGDCSSVFSREHLISKSLFLDTNITVSGFEWCDDKTINLDSELNLDLLALKILCTHHNNTLTNIDKAAAHLFQVFRETSNLVNSRTKSESRDFKRVVYDINAKKLEQWFLKTLINLTFNKGLYIGLNATQIGYPSEELVKICYNKDSFSGKAGMYFSALVGMDFKSDDEIIFTPLIKDSSYVVGGFFLLRGLSFYLCLDPTGSEFPLTQFKNLPVDWCNGELSKPFKKIDIKVNNIRSHTIRFNW